MRFTKKYIRGCVDFAVDIKFTAFFDNLMCFTMRIFI